MLKKTKYGKEARAALMGGVQKIAAAVKVTLGPAGRNAMISQSMVVDYGVHNLPIHVTKDGYTVARAFQINDEPFEQAGVLLIKEAAQKSVDQAGDGTTTTVVLAEAIVEKGMELVAAGANPMQLKRDIDKAVDVFVTELKKLSTPVRGDNNRIRQIATISANNDAEIGGWIAQAFEKIGEEGVINLEANPGVNTEIKIADGYKWDQSWVSPLFINNKEKQICEFENPYILIYQNRINHHTQVFAALDLANKEGRPLLIICEDAVDEGLAFLAMNNHQGRAKVCVVKAPSFGEGRRLEMEDIAMITGGTYISDIRGVSIKEIEYANFGVAKKVIVTKDDTVIIGGGYGDQGVKNHIENTLNELRMNLAQAKNEDERHPIEKRIAKITGGVAVIQVGAATETEMKERLDRYDDAVRATKAAIAEGFVAGGGTTFLRIKTGNEIVDFATEKVLEQICVNAGDDPKAIMDIVKNSNGDIGYNAKAGRAEDMVSAGIIDPTKVIRCALQNAASAATMILTSECLIVDTM
ncbi:MAG TPA: molecular chaperone GroEL [Ferruginibacter sp.]|jgi:chaperonin GroEL|nr:molecular chaperone GroEL [Ferruginibacter sp.]